MHYDRLPKRFWDKVEEEPNSGCWVWIGSKGSDGYGTFHGLSGRTVRSHRFAFEQLKHKIPQNLETDHLCRVPACVNPNHMELVTHRENGRRGLNGILTIRCRLRGHEFTVENTYYYQGKRFCRACGRLRVSQYQMRKRMGQVKL